MFAEGVQSDASLTHAAAATRNLKGEELTDFLAKQFDGSNAPGDTVNKRDVKHSVDVNSKKNKRRSKPAQPTRSDSINGV